MLLHVLIFRNAPYGARHNVASQDTIKYITINRQEEEEEEEERRRRHVTPRHATSRHVTPRHVT